MRETYQDGEEGSHDVRRDRKQLLGDGGLFRVDGSNNGRSEESYTLNRDIVQQEDKTNHERSRSKDSLLDSTSVHLVQDRGRSDMLGLDSTRGKVLLLLGQPFCDFWPVGHQQVGSDTDCGGNDAFDQEDLLPGVNLADAVQFENAASEKAYQQDTTSVAISVVRKSGTYHQRRQPGEHRLEVGHDQRGTR